MKNKIKNEKEKKKEMFILKNINKLKKIISNSKILSTIVSKPRSYLNNKENTFNLRKSENNNPSSIKKFLHKR